MAGVVWDKQPGLSPKALARAFYGTPTGLGEKRAFSKKRRGGAFKARRGDD